MTDLARGTRLGVYEISAKIGEGGMGEVYRARDTRLDRDVALKVLPADMATDPERLDRFRREARAVAALNHPNIVTIHSVEEADGTHFLTMELVEGRTLDAILTDDGLSQERFLELAVPLADAVAAAHAKGITHRDLKPQNVMLGSDGRGTLKVLDFGLARFAQEAAPREQGSQAATMFQTQEGLAVGTVPYMSPEQVEGRQVDARSDIFSLGVMFYEMATGRRPFGGDSSIAVVTAILRDEPASVMDLKPGFPAALDEIIRRCLAKGPGARYPDGEALHAVLARVGESRAEPDSGATDVPWIAVLPFKTRAADDELEALAEGLTEDITAGLSLFSHLLVVSATSAARHQGPLDVRAVGAELGAHFIIEGSVRKAGATVRVRAQLVDVTTGTHLWAEHFDRDLRESDVFEAQDDLTDRIVATVAEGGGVLTRALGALVAATPVDRMTAYQCVIRYYAYRQQIHPDEHAALRSALEQAVKREPEHADAWACLSELYAHEFSLRFNPRPDSLDRALRGARQAVELDATSPLAHYALAHAHYFRRELGPFRQAADRVVTLNPRDATQVGQMGQLIAFSGDWTSGLPVLERAMRLNPHHFGWLHFAHHFDHYRKGEYDQALEAVERINMPGYDMQCLVLAATCGQLGRFDEARAHVDTLLTVGPELAANVRAECRKWLASEELIEHIVDGLRKAGLEVDGDPSPARSRDAPGGAPTVRRPKGRVRQARCSS